MMVAIIEKNRRSLGGWGLLALRLVVGLVFVMHGGQKIFVKGMPAVAGFLGQVGLEPPMVWAVVLTGAEIVGGVALIVGALTRIAAVTLGITMVVAIATVLGTKGFFLPGYEFALTLLGAAVAIALTGPGPYAIDAGLGVDG
jgi:putative oxidoreductase